jgi:hypothetical protein
MCLYIICLFIRPCLNITDTGDAQVETDLKERGIYFEALFSARRQIDLYACSKIDNYTRYFALLEKANE